MNINDGRDKEPTDETPSEHQLRLIEGALAKAVIICAACGHQRARHRRQRCLGKLAAKAGAHGWSAEGCWCPAFTDDAGAGREQIIDDGDFDAVDALFRAEYLGKKDSPADQLSLLEEYGKRRKDCAEKSIWLIDAKLDAKGALSEPEVTGAQAADGPTNKGGRPRADDDRKRVTELREQGKSWGQIATMVNKENNQKKSKDAYRRLLQPSKIK
jgi:hypothetical protein